MDKNELLTLILFSYKITRKKIECAEKEMINRLFFLFFVLFLFLLYTKSTHRTTALRHLITEKQKIEEVGPQKSQFFRHGQPLEVVLVQGRGVVGAVGLREPLGELPGAQPVQRLVHVLLQVLVAADHVVLGAER